MLDNLTAMGRDDIDKIVAKSSIPLEETSRQRFRLKKRESKGPSGFYRTSTPYTILQRRKSKQIMS